jgi:aryl-alcohol dehydrogenase-like predicted oxidoreductase
MQFTTLGRTGLRVSVAGLGAGGFSRLGLRAGKTEAECARLIEEAFGLGVNIIDTAPAYGTEGVVGLALKSIPRDEVVIATKAQIHRNDVWFTPDEVVASLDNSLRVMGIDTVDVLNLHGVEAHEYDYALNTIAPALLEQKAKGKIRHIGVTETPIEDHTNKMLTRALRDPVWEVVMVGFHMLHQGARTRVFPITREKGVGTLLMFAVRSIFADPPRIARELKALAAQGLVDNSQIDINDPLGFLIHEGGAANLTEAAYRYARHEPGVDVVLFGTGSAEHLRENVASLLKPPLPEADRAKLNALFGHLSIGIGMDSQASRTPAGPAPWLSRVRGFLGRQKARMLRSRPAEGR